MTPNTFISKWNDRFKDNDYFKVDEADLREFAADIMAVFGVQAVNVPLYVPGTYYAQSYLVRYTVAGAAEAFFYSLQEGNLPAPTATGDDNWRVVPGPVPATALSQSLTLLEAQGIGGRAVVAGRDYVIDFGPDEDGAPVYITVAGVSNNQFDVEGTFVGGSAGEVKKVGVNVTSGVYGALVTVQDLAQLSGTVNYLSAIKSTLLPFAGTEEEPQQVLQGAYYHQNDAIYLRTGATADVKALDSTDTQNWEAVVVGGAASGGLTEYVTIDGYRQDNGPIQLTAEHLNKQIRVDLADNQTLYLPELQNTTKTAFISIVVLSAIGGADHTLTTPIHTVSSGGSVVLKHLETAYYQSIVQVERVYSPEADEVTEVVSRLWILLGIARQPSVAARIATPTSPALTFLQDAECVTIYNGTFTVDPSGAVPGVVVRVRLASGTSAPQLPAGFTRWGGAWDDTKTNLYSFCVAADSTIDYYIQQPA